MLFPTTGWAWQGASHFLATRLLVWSVLSVLVAGRRSRCAPWLPKCGVSGRRMCRGRFDRRLVTGIRSEIPGRDRSELYYPPRSVRRSHEGDWRPPSL